MNILYLLEGVSVGIFGMVLSAAFCDITWTSRKKWIMAVSMAAIFLLQGGIYIWVDPEVIPYLYPLITHLPLTVVLCVLNRQILWPVVSVLTAYLCCQLRRWTALLVVAAFGGGTLMEKTAETILTIPLLWLLLRFIAPSVRSLSKESRLLKWQFGVIPALSYGFDYLTRIYTDWLYRGAAVAVEFMPFVCSVAYILFVLQTSADKRMRNELERTQSNLNMQIAQAVREIEGLRESQQRAGTYRHDLRHHMQYLLGCIRNGKQEQAENYIHQVCSEIEADKITVYCENEVMNLVLSSFAGRAEKSGIPISIQTRLPAKIPVSEVDFCVLLSNALENALHACEALKSRERPARIEVTAYERNGRIFLQVINSCDPKIPFRDGIPVTDRQGHGMGVRSICAIVQRYNGVCSFQVQDQDFVLRVSF